MPDATPTDTKWWGITALSTVLPALGPALGIDITADLVHQLGEQVVQTVQVVGG
jgi:hypothetical protein